MRRLELGDEGRNSLNQSRPAWVRDLVGRFDEDTSRASAGEPGNGCFAAWDGQVDDVGVSGAANGVDVWLELGIEDAGKDPASAFVVCCDSECFASAATPKPRCWTTRIRIHDWSGLASMVLATACLTRFLLTNRTQGLVRLSVLVLQGLIAIVVAATTMVPAC